MALSSTFLRSICTNARKGWPTKEDKGQGEVIKITQCGDIHLVTVKWQKSVQTYNENNLILFKNILDDARKAEHEKNPNFNRS